MHKCVHFTLACLEAGNDDGEWWAWFSWQGVPSWNTFYQEQCLIAFLRCGMCMRERENVDYKCALFSICQFSFCLTSQNVKSLEYLVGGGHLLCSFFGWVQISERNFCSIIIFSITLWGKIVLLFHASFWTCNAISTWRFYYVGFNKNHPISEWLTKNEKERKFQVLQQR